jgi:hypothetical protein
MRDYSKVSPLFWTGATCKALRKRGSEGVVVALYLMSAPGSNMLGLYYQPTLFMAHETGLGYEGALKGLQDCVEVGFCAYDETSEMVWVFEMASYQIASELKASDNRCAGIQKEYDALPNNPHLGGFYDRYVDHFHLTVKREFQEGLDDSLPSPLLAPPKPRTGAGAGTRAGTKPSASSTAKLPTCQPQAVIDLYHELLPEMPKVQMVKDARKRALLKVWTWVLTSTRADGSRRATTADEALQWFSEYFTRARANDFLMGKTPRSGEHANWKCDFDFLLTDKGMGHVIEKTIVKEDA